MPSHSLSLTHTQTYVLYTLLAFLILDLMRVFCFLTSYFYNFKWDSSTFREIRLFAFLLRRLIPLACLYSKYEDAVFETVQV